MEFKKIDIDAETFKTISEEAWQAYVDANGDSCEEDFKLVLSTVVFNVKKPFAENEWNSCEVIPPSKYHLRNALIRIKTTDKSLKTSLGRYRLGTYYRDKPDMFFDYVDRPVFNIKEGSSDLEYKFIED